MMQFVTSPLLETLPHLIHGFGMRSEEPLPGVVFPKQIHGDHVEALDAPVPEAWHREADALITTLPSFPIGVKTADCLPIFIAEGKGIGVAVVHAGWRGVALGILPKALRLFMEVVKSPPEELFLAVGPGIGACCLEVDAPVRDFFLARGQAANWEISTRPGREGHWWLDLKMMVKRQALEVGMQEERVDILPYCTRCDEAYFYSYRREGLAAGRQANYIVFKEPEADS